jgi:alkylhydroperoxidase family enzyme
MSRLPYVDLDEAAPELRELTGRGPVLNLYRVLPHAGPAAIGFLKLGGALLRENALDSRLRELVILRVGVLCRSSYEQHQHRRIARAVGVTEEKIAAIEQGADSDAFDAWEKLVLQFTDAVVNDVKAPADLFAAVSEMLDHRRMSELVITIGFYMMVSRYLENFEVDIESPEHGAR